MEKKEERQSNWNPVAELMEGADPIELGAYTSYWYHQTPRRMLHSLSYYKFAAKLIGKGKRVLDVGCNEGLGSWVIAKECGFCKGIDFDEAAVATARRNFEDPSIEFSSEDFLEAKPVLFDAAVSFDVIEHILPENAPRFLGQIAAHLSPHGCAYIGTPSKISQEFASEVSKAGHVNIYTHLRLEEEMRAHFDFVFLFSANDEVVHTGYLPLAHYFLAVGCRPKKIPS